MRICIFSRLMMQHREHYPPVPCILARDFLDMGHQVVALTTRLPNGGSGVFLEDRLEVHYLARSRPGVTDQQYWRSSAQVFDELHSIQPFDVVLGRGNSVHGYHSFSRFSGQVPVVCHEGTYPDWPHRLERLNGIAARLLFRPVLMATMFFRWYYRKSIMSADMVVYNSPALANTLSKISFSVRPRTMFIPYGFDIGPYDDALGVFAKKLPPSLMFVGRLAWDKGVIAMVEILAKLQRKDVILEVIGPSSPKVRSRISRRAAQLGVRDRFYLLGPIHNSLLPEKLVTASVFLLPTTHAEGLNKSIMEAMAACLPVVTYEMPGMNVLVKQGETGWIVPTRDTESAAAAIDDLLNDPDRAGRMGRAGRALIQEDFSPKVVKSLWNTVFEDVIRERSLHSNSELSMPSLRLN